MNAPFWVAVLLMAISFVVLARCADVFVVESVAIAEKFHVPKLVIGLVLVSLATTVPEVAVSLQSALSGQSQMALGNAMGSIACNTGIALALCGMLSAKPIPVLPAVLRGTGGCLLFCIILAFLFVVGDSTISRFQGLALLIVLAIYLGWLLRGRHHQAGVQIDAPPIPAKVLKKSVFTILVVFTLSLAGIIISSRFVLHSALAIARALHMPETMIAMTLVALGTSVPEVATSISAARRGHGEMAVGNILGANIMNICWVVGASALVRPLTLTGREIAFMFPSVLALTVIALFVLASRGTLSRKEGFVLLSAYLIYLGCMPWILPVRV